MGAVTIAAYGLRPPVIVPQANKIPGYADKPIAAPPNRGWIAGCRKSRHCLEGVKDDYASPHTSRAVSTTNRNLAACCSTWMSLPCTVLANPHWGDSAN